MSGLTSEELSLLRDETEVWFEFTCDIHSPGASADDAYGGRGGAAHDATADQTGIPCNIESGAAHEVERAFIGLIAEMQVYTVTVPALTTVHVGDHIVVHGTDESPLHVKVHAVTAPEGQEIERRVITVQEGRETHG